MLFAQSFIGDSTEKLTMNSRMHIPAATVLTRGKIQAGERGLRLLAKQAVDSLEKGLIELITNVDESYHRLEQRGEVVSGKIEISVDRHTRTKPTIVEVVDYAEGMDADEMKEFIAKYGEDTSRGGFGMGLKDALIAFGGGEVISFKHGRKWHCTVAENGDYTIGTPQKITSVDRKMFPNHERGTVVRAFIPPGQFPIGRMDTLKANLQTHVCLRTIMSDPKRTVLLSDGKIREKLPLTYCPPDGELIREEMLQLPGYRDVQPLLRVFMAKGAEPLTQAGFCRTGGIVIKSFRACHEATLFGFDEDQHAARLFGELVCDKLDELQRAGEQVVTKERDGLRRQHLFNQALVRTARRVIEEIVTAERKRAEQQQRVLESEETRRRFKDAVKSLNEIATKELEGAPGTGAGKDGRQPPAEIRPPFNGFEFIPDSYRVVLAEPEILKLRIQLGSDIQIGDVIAIESNVDRVKILHPTIAVPIERYENPPIAIAKVAVEGVQPNAEAWITARCNGKEAHAEVEVVSKKRERESTLGGLFREIKYRVDDQSPRRVYFDRHTGIIWINTAESSVQLYFGPDGAGQEEAPNQCLVAELVTQVACEEIARVRREKGKLDIPAGIKELDAFYGYLDKLRMQNAALIHKLLVDRNYRRA
jgi:hypothetical protein